MAEGRARHTGTECDQHLCIGYKMLNPAPVCAQGYSCRLQSGEEGIPLEGVVPDDELGIRELISCEVRRVAEGAA